MRFSAVFKAVRFAGIFWNQRFIPYGKTWQGWGYTFGPQKTLRATAWRYGDGLCARGLNFLKPAPREFAQEMGFFLLEHSTPFASVVEPWAWALYHKIRAHSYIGLRLKLGLPAHGQRTRSNHRTAQKQKTTATVYLYNNLGVVTGGYAASRGGQFVKKKTSRGKAAPKGSAKARKGPVVRTIKKSNVWR